MIAAVLLLVGSAGLGGWLLNRDETAAAVTPSTETVSMQTVEETVAASGTVAAAASAEESFAVSGTVTAVLVEAGDRVRAGEALARVDADTLRAQRSAASSSLDAALEQWDTDLDAGASDVQLAADETAVISARASLADARQSVRDAVLRASIGGTVTSVGVEVGDVVGSGGSGTTGGTTGATGGDTASDTASTAAVSLVSRNTFVVETTVSSADIDKVVDGLQAEVSVTGVDDTVYATVAEVSAIAQTSSSGAAVFAVTLQVTGRRSDLYAGTTAEATIVVRQREGVLTVNTRALQSDDEGTYVDVVIDGGTERRTVEVGDTYGMATEVSSGLSEGDVVQIPGFTLPAGGGQEGGTGEMPDRGQMPDFGGGQPPAGGFGGGMG